MHNVAEFITACKKLKVPEQKVLLARALQFVSVATSNINLCYHRPFTTSLLGYGYFLWSVFSLWLRASTASFSQSFFEPLSVDL